MTFHTSLRPVVISLAALSTLLLSACADFDLEALNYADLTEFAVQDNQLLMNGPINSRSYAQFIEAIEDHPEVDTLVALDVPGSLDDSTMIRLAYEVRRRGRDRPSDAARHDPRARDYQTLRRHYQSSLGQS